MIKKILGVLTVCILAAGTAAAAASAEQWEPMPLVTEEQLNRGNTGGEGCQWPLSLVMDARNGNFMLMGTDVGGVYRSLDGGENWEQASVGMDCRGACAMAVDPENPNHVLLVGANSMTSEYNGIYVSMDQAETWERTYKANLRGYRDIRDQIVFDPGSFNGEICTTAYWSRSTGADFGYGEQGEDLAGLYKTTDGGYHWELIPGTHDTAGYSILKYALQGDQLILYTGNSSGFFRSTDGGQNFEKLLNGSVTGLDVPSEHSPIVVLCTNGSGGGIYRSEDYGTAMQKVESEDYRNFTVPVRVKVSPVNPDCMIILDETINNNSDYENNRPYYSEDGGVTWTRSVMDSYGSFIPFNARNYTFLWDSQKEGVVWSFGGDWISKSTDGGRIFRWNNNGNVGIMPGGSFQFNFDDPDLLYIVSQDFNGALTEDGGESWSYINHTGEDWGGWGYGAYAVSSQLLITEKKDWSSNHEIVVSRDGGKNFTTIDLGSDSANNKIYIGSWDSGALETAYADPFDDHYLFVHDYFSTDQGYTWNKMNGCDGVVTHNPETGTLYGGCGGNIVESDDHGVTWVVTASFDERVRDIAYSPDGVFYAALGDKIGVYTETDQKTEYITDALPADNMKNHRIVSVAIDPNHSDIIYACGSGNNYATNTAVVRSTDGGKTWVRLSKALPSADGQNAVTEGLDGAHEANWVRVHPETSYAYVGGQCFGMWKIAPPGTDNDPDLKALKVTDGDRTAELTWYGNGKLDLTDLADQALLVNSPNTTLEERYRYDLDGDRTITENDLSLSILHYLEDLQKEEDTYTVYRTPSGEENWEILAANLTVPGFSDNTVSNGGAWSYRVKNDRTQEYTQTVTAHPSDRAPSYVHAAELEQGVRLSWEKRAGKYNVYRSTSETDGYEMIASGLTLPVYTDFSVVQGTDYFYKVTVGSETESSPSEARKASTRRDPQMQPEVNRKTDEQFADGIPADWETRGMTAENGTLYSQGTGESFLRIKNVRYQGSYNYDIDITEVTCGQDGEIRFLFDYLNERNYCYVSVKQSGIQICRLYKGEVQALSDEVQADFAGNTLRIEHSTGNVRIKRVVNGAEEELLNAGNDVFAGGFIGLWTENSRVGIDRILAEPFRDPRDATSKIGAADFDGSSEGIEVHRTNTGEAYISGNTGDYVKYQKIDFQDGVTAFTVKAAVNGRGTLELRLDAPDGPLLLTCEIEAAAGETGFAAKTFSIPEDMTGGAAGVRDLYLVFGSELSAESFQFVYKPVSVIKAEETVIKMSALSGLINGTINASGEKYVENLYGYSRIYFNSKVEVPGKYKVEFEVATDYNGQKFSLYSNDNNLITVSPNATGGWASFAYTEPFEIMLPEGEQLISIRDAASVNIRAMRFTLLEEIRPEPEDTDGFTVYKENFESCIPGYLPTGWSQSQQAPIKTAEWSGNHVLACDAAGTGKSVYEAQNFAYLDTLEFWQQYSGSRPDCKAEIYFNYRESEDSYYKLVIHTQKDQSEGSSPLEIQLVRRANGTDTLLASGCMGDFASGSWPIHYFKILCEDKEGNRNFQVFVMPQEGGQYTKLMEGSDPEPLADGMIAFGTEQTAAAIDDILIKYGKESHGQDPITDNRIPGALDMEHVSDIVNGTIGDWTGTSSGGPKYAGDLKEGSIITFRTYVEEAGTYDVKMMLATDYDEYKEFDLYSGETKLGTIPGGAGTGGWWNWGESGSTTVMLDAGEQDISIRGAAGINIQYAVFEKSQPDSSDIPAVFGMEKASAVSGGSITYLEEGNTAGAGYIGNLAASGTQIDLEVSGLEAGIYEAVFTLATEYGGYAGFDLYSGEQLLAAVPGGFGTGGWWNWEKSSAVTVELPEGVQRLSIKGATGINLLKVEFIKR